MANWNTVQIDLEQIPVGEFKFIAVDWQGNTQMMDLPFPSTVEFKDTQYVECPFNGASYKVYQKVSNADDYEYYNDITDTIEISVRIVENIKTLILKFGARPITGFVQIY